MNTMLPVGFTIRVAQEGADYRWAIKRWKTVLETGVQPSEKAAKKKMYAALIPLVASAAEKGAERSALRLKLRSWVIRRPYVAMHVFYGLSEGRKTSDILNRAVEEEQELWRRDKKKGIALPLPSSPLAKSPYEVATVMVDLCKKLGLEGKKAWKYASDMLGMAFSNPEAENHLVVEKKTKSPEEEYPDAEAGFDEEGAE